MINYFNWTELNTIYSNFIWLEMVVSWEDTSSVLLNDFFIPFTFFNSFFIKFFFSTDSLNFISLLDIFLNLNLNASLILVNFFFFDFLIELLTINYYWIFLLFNNDSFLVFFFYNNDFCFFINDFLLSISDFFLPTVSNLYDSFSFKPANSFLDFLYFYFWLVINLVFFINFLRLINFTRFGSAVHSNFFLTKFFLFANTLSFENRLQLDWVLLFFFFCLVIWIPLLMTYDDINVEVVELMHMFICLFFLLIIFYLLFKYSIHYFSFLENSVSEGFSTSYIAKQFVRDVSNTFALFLRFFLLLFRLNIYDGLDDFLDSYYIFFIDFDEDSYYDELFFITDFFFITDNREDIIFYSPTEFSWFLDLFSKYFIIFGKIFYFWAFILEEIFRVSLALYISYLIVFEVHAVNVSMNESNFFFKKK